MATKKARQRISYVLENARTSAGGHRLGVLGVAIDTDKNILYSGGRDGVVCAWDVNLDQRHGRTNGAADNDASANAKPATTFRAQTHAHMHWINDILLTQNNTALVSASSDLTVKVWRPHSEEHAEAQPIGTHSDYVNRLAAPPADMGLNWVASGGLDRKVCLWDLNGGGQTLEIDVKGEDKYEKGSVYALSVGRNTLACGGPEKTVRLYDPRSGSRVSKLVGHVDNIRSILIDEAGDTILSASADKTIKLWSIKGGRCMYTFTMHDDAVWSLYSDDPRLGVFYSSDRSGLVAKTDVRGSIEDMDDGLSVAVAQEHSSVWKLIAAGGNIWTATGQSSINRWDDVDMDAHVHLRDTFRRQRGSSTTSSRPRPSSLPPEDAVSKKEISPNSVLRVSNTAPLPLRTGFDPESNTAPETVPRKLSELVIEQPDLDIKPIHHLPAETIEGQFGLLKHQLLNDRRRVLTLDTAGEVLMWDLIKCKPIQSFGKQHLEDVERRINTREAVAPWCGIDLSSGNLTVVLEQYNCFDAEVYADELALEEPVEFREDQRISLGRWILRYLFSNLIDEEIKRDEVYRQNKNEGVEQKQAVSRANAPASIPIPEQSLPGPELDQTTTPRAAGTQQTPGLKINEATPGPAPPLPGVPEGPAASPLSPLEKRTSHTSRRSGDKDDYFSSSIAPADAAAKPSGTAVSPAGGDSADATSRPADSSGAEKEKGKDKGGDNVKSPGGAFGKKFRMSFGAKKLARSGSQATQEKPPVVDEKAEEESESSSTHGKEEVEDNFYGVIQKIRNDYERQLAEDPGRTVETGIAPSLPSDTPVLKLPPNTKVLIQEETSGSVANIYEGTVGSVGKDADIIEQKGPMWLGHVLLQNQVPYKDPVKVSFVLHPLGDLPPVASADGNNRLNANRMLRVRKILSYVAERIEQQPEEPEEDAPRPEEYLELYCNEQLLDPLMSLATLRTQVWKGGNDIVLYYKANGRKEIRPVPPPSAEPVPEAEAPQDAQANTATTPGQDA